jgi:hypothetical protein
VSAVGLGLAAQCGSRGGTATAISKKCEVAVVEDTMRVYAGRDTVYSLMGRDTVPRPRAAPTCLTLYANAGDTVPRPK